MAKISTRYQSTLDYVARWQENPNDPIATQEMMRDIDPIIQSYVNKWSMGGNVPRVALEMRAKTLALKALKDFDPNRGVNVKTYLYSRMAPISRLVYANQNMGKIPEARIMLIGKYKNSRQRLMDDLGREPSTAEIADHMSVPMKHVSLLESELKPEFPDNPLMGYAVLTEEEDLPKRGMEYIYLELSPREQIVMEHWLGMHGKRRVQSNDTLASKSRLTANQVRSLKTRISNRMRDWLSIQQ